MSRWGLSLKKIPLLEELSLIHRTMITAEDIDDVGRYCPLLKTFKLNRRGFFKKEEPDHVNYTGIAIAKYLPSLSHLELIGDSLNNIGLQAIMDGCTHLESLDIRQCMYIDLKKDNIGKRCSERFKDVKLPNDSMEGGYMHLVANYEEPSMMIIMISDSDGNMKEFEPWNDTQECNDYVKFYLR
ncbi:putative F-box/LRR-repeat protein 23 [Rutidosis leptorrhynchoides]|uniref:putative F-box/LRR-repeat protein 23 n=1 Tax=Rutidosis leptorrhynchoides TaxID=125765 RepID=UPI003A99C7C2